MQEIDHGILGDKLKYSKFHAAICTQKRVVEIRREYSSDGKRWNDSTESLELSNIQSVREEVVGSVYNWRRVRISSDNTRVLFNFYSSQEASATFASVVRNAIEQVKAKTIAAISPTNVEMRIKALKKLRQDGTITEAQFQQKLQEIVDQL